MSVIIKGMEMPSECRACPLCQYYPTVRETRCRMTGEVMAYGFGALKFNGRSEHCPLAELPEKHGRLIDADKLFDAMKYSNWKILYSSDGTFLDISKFSEIIRNIPTVIEAEGEK